MRAHKTRGGGGGGALHQSVAAFGLGIDSIMVTKLLSAGGNFTCMIVMFLSPLVFWYASLFK